MLQARDAARSAGHQARRTIAERAIPLGVPSAHDVEPCDTDESSRHRARVRGRILSLRPQDADLIHAELTAQNIDDVPSHFDAWLRHVSETFPESLAHAAPQGFLRRLFGRGPDPAIRGRATAELMQHLDISNAPATRQIFHRALPTGTQKAPLKLDQIRRAAAAALGAPPDALTALPTHELRDVALAVLANVEDTRAGEELDRAARAAAELVVDSSATTLLADIDMDHFRSRASVGRFPARALDRAGIRTVADVLATGREQLTVLEGIGRDTAHALVIAAKQLRTQARAQAKIDLSSDAPAAVRLRTALKAVLNHQLHS